MDFAASEADRHGLLSDAADAVQEVIVATKKPDLIDLRSVLRMLDAFEQTLHRPRLH